MGSTQDTEITLGTGKLLGIFFLMVAVCAAFFTMGYLFGRGSTTAAASTTVVGTVPSAGSPANKPSAGGSKAPGAVQPSAADSSTSTQAAATPQPTLLPVKATEESTASTPPAEVKPGTNGSFMVQVAAVSRQEDAEILVNALRKKQYPVLIVSNVPGDSLFHVQVGPFSDPRDAEAMRSRLAGDGYNAIVKK